MIALLLAVVAAYGVHLVWTARALGWSGLAPGPHREREVRRRATLRRWLVQAGLDDVEPKEFVAVATALAMVGGLLAYTVFGSAGPALIAAIFAGSFPVAMFRNRRRQCRERAQEAWPRIIEEIRILTGAVGRSIPQALFEAGHRAPGELQPAFDSPSRVAHHHRLRPHGDRPQGAPRRPHRGRRVRDVAGGPRSRRRRPRPTLGGPCR